MSFRNTLKQMWNLTATIALNELNKRASKERDILAWRDIIAPQPSSGVNVDQHSAMSYVTVFACVDLLSRLIASLPLQIYKRLPDGGRELAVNHYLYNVLHTQPNPELTSYKYRETIFAHILLWGNSYSEIEVNGAGRVTALWPIHPSRVEVLRDSAGTLYYEITTDQGQSTVLPASKILHLRGLGPDGILGYSVIELQAEAIGHAIAAQKYSGKFFANDSTPNGLIKHPKALTDKAVKNIRESWERGGAGLDNAHRVKILEEGMEWQQLGIPAKDAQLIETMKFTSGQIASFFHVPPHLVGLMDSATFSNIEHQSIELVQFNLGPWCTNIEQQMSVDLLFPNERRTYYIEHNLDGILRGDTKSRYEAYAKARVNGWMTENEIRLKENMNPSNTDDADLTFIQGAMVPARNQLDASTINSNGDGTTNNPDDGGNA